MRNVAVAVAVEKKEVEKREKGRKEAYNRTATYILGEDCR